MRFDTSFVRNIAFCALIAGLSLVAIGQCRQKERARRERDDIALRAAELVKTIEWGDGLYLAKTMELDRVSSLLSARTSELASANERLERQGSRLMYYTELSLKWRRRYEGLARSTQTTVPPDPDVPGSQERLRVDFTREMGPFSLSGHTLTSPPEAFVSLEQVRPIRLGVSLAQARDGTWSTVVSTAEGEEYSVDVDVSAVDRGLERSGWRDRLAIDLDVGLYDSPSLGVGVRYGGRVSVGPRCAAFHSDGLAWSCGVGVSWRPLSR